METVRLAARGLREVGLEPARELERAGVKMVDGVIQEGISRASYCALWKRMTRTAGEDFGLRFAAALEGGTLGALEWLGTSAPNLGTGLAALARCGRLLHTGGHHAFEQSADEGRFVYYPGHADVPRAVIDWSFTYFVRCMRRIAAEPIAPKAVYLQYARPERVSAVEDAFGAPVFFDAPYSAVVFSREHLDVPFVSHDPDVHASLDALCRSRCASAAEAGLESRVKTTLLRQLADEAPPPAIAEVAKRLGLSTRSLQRGLRGEGLSFRQIVLDARMEMAERWLADPARTITEIAYALGYSEPSAFHRAYRNHFGRPCRDD